MKKICIAVSAVLFAVPVFALQQPLAASDMAVKTPKVQVVNTSASSAEIFMELDNKGIQARKLIAANSPVAAQTQLHETLHQHGMDMMEQIKSITIKPHGDRELQAGGFHVMLMGLKQPLKSGDTVPVTLIFADGSSLQITAPVA